MKEIVSRKLCTGCSACYSICPKNAINLVEKEDGFKYPVIDQNKCIDCGLCKRICPVLNTKKNNSLNKCYVGYNKSDLEKEKSSSGAIFGLIANCILDNDGIVIGAGFDENNRLKHIAVNNKKDLEKLKGSKYLQSDIGNIYTYIKENIKNKKILFVGTPCQVAGIKQIIKNKNLICLDLICHGVPSSKLFSKYINELEEKYNDKLINYNFRDKTTGWDTYSNTITFKNNKVTELANDNKYMKLFLSDVALRKSCYNCNFKLGNKYSDITLGDFWGVQKHYPEMYSNKGVSAIIINTKLGIELFESVRNNMEYEKCNLEEILINNPSLEKSSKLPRNRAKFFEDINNISVDKLTKRYGKKSNILIKILLKIKQILKNEISK